MVRYYLAKIVIHTKKKKLVTLIRLELQNDANIRDQIIMIAAKWINEKPEIIDESFFFVDNKINVTPDIYKEISAETFIELDGIVPKFIDKFGETIH